MKLTAMILLALMSSANAMGADWRKAIRHVVQVNVSPSKGSGGGVIVAPRFVITSAHLTHSEVSVSFGQKLIEARVLKRSTKVDLSLLFLEESVYPSADICTDELKLGDEVFVIARFGDKTSLLRGYVSMEEGVRRVKGKKGSSNRRMVMIGTQSFAGVSGGGVFNHDNCLVGIGSTHGSLLGIIQAKHFKEVMP